MKSIKVRTTQNIDIEYAVAGLGYRMLAYLVDWLLFMALYAILYSIVFSLPINHNGYFVSGIWITFMFTYVFYDLLCEVFMNGQSIGKRIVKLKVIKLDGSSASIGDYLLRWLLRLVDSPFSLFLAGAISILSTANGQRLGDLAAGTTVISLRHKPQFKETIFEDFEEDYQVQYPEVQQLSDRDIRLIKEVLGDLKQIENREITYKLSQKMEEVLGVKSKHPPMTFIKTILKDYNYLNSEF